MRPPLANELLAQSGNKAIFITQCGNHDQQPMFLWHKRNPKESHEDYFRRIEAYATSNSKALQWVKAALWWTCSGIAGQSQSPTQHPQGSLLRALPWIPFLSRHHRPGQSPLWQTYTRPLGTNCLHKDVSWLQNESSQASKALPSPLQNSMPVKNGWPPRPAAGSA